LRSWTFDLNLSKRMNRLCLALVKLHCCKVKVNGRGVRHCHEVRKSGIYVTAMLGMRICGYVDKSNRKSQSVFECKFCHSIIHADVNAPRNLKKRSLSCTISTLHVPCKYPSCPDKEFFRFFIKHGAEAFTCGIVTQVSLLPADPYFAGNLAQLKGH